MSVWTGRPFIQEFAQMICVLRLPRIGYGFFQSEDPQGDALRRRHLGADGPQQGWDSCKLPPGGIILVSPASPLPLGLAPVQGQPRLDAQMLLQRYIAVLAGGQALADDPQSRAGCLLAHHPR